MKRCGIILLMFVVFLLCAGCSNPAAPDSSSQPPEEGLPFTVHEGESLPLIRSLMALDYNTMTVAEFNQAIEKRCAEAGTSVFAVISDAYDHYTVYDHSGEFVGVLFTDHELELFMQTTLDYSAQEIFGEPVHLGSIMYMREPGVTAGEFAEKKEQMSFAEWEEYYAENIDTINIFPVLSYAIEREMKNPEALSVAERDGRLNQVQAAIHAFILGLDEETAQAENLWDLVEAEFARISAEYSDAGLTITCTIQALERDIEAE